MKKAYLFASVLFAGFALNASYLMWQVDPSSAEDGGNTAGAFAGQYNAARIGYYQTSQATPGATLADMEKAGGIISYTDEVYPASGAMSSPASLDLSSLGAGYTYFIELVNYDSTANHIAYGEALAYSDLAAKGYVSSELPSDGMKLPATWHGGTYNAVPEPTSVLMVMFGLAFLGLKRRTV